MTRWLSESGHKRSLKSDLFKLRWLDPHLKQLYLDEIDASLIKKLAEIKTDEGVSNATINRMFALIRSILNKAVKEWEWLDKSPTIKLYCEDNRRIRWLSQVEADKLIAELPSHLAKMAAFTLATGLRQSNVKNLRWKDIDLKRRHAWVNSEDMKTKKAIAVPLNDSALSVLQSCFSDHSEYVFTYKGKPVSEVNTKAWRKALKRAGIENFRWHDLRHTWASWHVQRGTSLHELQLLGGWSNFNMVLRYAHLSSSHLQAAAQRVCVTNSLQGVLA